MPLQFNFVIQAMPFFQHNKNQTAAKLNETFWKDISAVRCSMIQLFINNTNCYVQITQADMKFFTMREIACQLNNTDKSGVKL